MLSVSDMHFLSLSLSRANLWCSFVHLLIAFFSLVFKGTDISEKLSSMDCYILQKSIDQNVKKGVKKFIKIHGKKFKNL